MKYISDTTWPEVFEHWRTGEASNPDWIRTAVEVKGWPDWESWRMFTANQLGLPQRSWAIFEFKDPMNEIPSMLVGPYTGWQSRLPKPNTHTFTNLVSNPVQYEHFAKWDSVQRLTYAFPADQLMTGLKKPDGSIVLIEGHHRAVSVAIARHDGKTIAFPEPVRIALANLTEADAGLLDRVLARGSEKNPPNLPKK
jgi:hypothetical protein